MSIPSWLATHRAPYLNTIVKLFGNELAPLGDSALQDPKTLGKALSTRLRTRAKNLHGTRAPDRWQCLVLSMSCLALRAGRMAASVDPVLAFGLTVTHNRYPGPRQNPYGRLPGSRVLKLQRLLSKHGDAILADLDALPPARATPLVAHLLHSIVHLQAQAAWEPSDTDTALRQRLHQAACVSLEDPTKPLPLQQGLPAHDCVRLMSAVAALNPKEAALPDTAADHLLEWAHAPQHTQSGNRIGASPNLFDLLSTQTKTRFWKAFGDAHLLELLQEQELATLWTALAPALDPSATDLLLRLASDDTSLQALCWLGPALSPKTIEALLQSPTLHKAPALTQNNMATAAAFWGLFHDLTKACTPWGKASPSVRDALTVLKKSPEARWTKALETQTLLDQGKPLPEHLAPLEGLHKKHADMRQRTGGVGLAQRRDLFDALAHGWLLEPAGALLTLKLGTQLSNYEAPRFIGPAHALFGPLWTEALRWLILKGHTKGLDHTLTWLHQQGHHAPRVHLALLGTGKKTHLEPALEALWGSGSEITAAVIDMLGGSKAGQRLAAVRYLQPLGDPQAIAAMKARHKVERAKAVKEALDAALSQAPDVPRHPLDEGAYKAGETLALRQGLEALRAMLHDKTLMRKPNLATWVRLCDHLERMRLHGHAELAIDYGRDIIIDQIPDELRVMPWNWQQHDELSQLCTASHKKTWVPMAFFIDPTSRNQLFDAILPTLEVPPEGYDTVYCTLQRDHADKFVTTVLKGWMWCFERKLPLANLQVRYNSGQSGLGKSTTLDLLHGFGVELWRPWTDSNRSFSSSGIRTAQVRVPSNHPLRQKHDMTRHLRHLDIRKFLR